MAARSRLRTAIKRVRTADGKAAAQEALATATSVIDKTARKGIIHKNQAARHKSRRSSEPAKSPVSGQGTREMGIYR